tara:strand:- start:11711 stop:11848 length:138 start_codon:yes stop_codon:yes gene_type:complete
VQLAHKVVDGNFLSHLSGDEEGVGASPDRLIFLSHLSGDEVCTPS